MLGMALSIVVNTAFRFNLNKITTERYNLTYYANLFMDSSAYLTRQARAYAATGDQEYHDNYWNEVNVLKNREKGVENLKKIGITAREQEMIDQMAELSNGLVPKEAKAMELAAAGDTSAALAIVYSQEYKDTVDQIASLRDQFLKALDKRCQINLNSSSKSYDVVMVITWIIVAAIIVIQLMQKKALYHMAYVDSLTGSDNYTAFREKMRGGGSISGEGYVISADLRGFSSINNTCGVAKGDQVIREMSKILTSDLKQGELAAHISGDKFVMFLHSDTQEDLIERISTLRSNIMDLSPLLDVPHVVPVFGIRAVDDPSHPENSYSDANLAKQQMEEHVDYFYAIFDAETRKRVLNAQHLEDNFEPAIKEHQFEMWYQPKYCPITGKMVAAEALVRWRRPDGTMIPPGHFIPLFERNGMIAKLDEYTFESVCAQQKKWLDEGLGVVPVSVNVSRASLYYPDIAARYIVSTSRYGLSADCIELEITESAMDSNRNIEDLIEQFQICGFRILVDDFGSGYSSLSTLTKKYFDNIKIDKSLVDCINTPEGDSLLKSIIQLAHEFHMTVTAEGVEEKNQVDFLLQLNCDNIQGFYYSRPLPASEFHALLKEAGTTYTQGK